MTAAAPPWRLATRAVPMREGEPCGDAVASFEWPVSAPQAGRLLAVIDGLGHGAEAAEAAQEALRVLEETPDAPLHDLFDRLDHRLLTTRGAAIGLVRLESRRLVHAGIGNTRTLRLRAAASMRLPSQNGIVGGGTRLLAPLNELDLEPGDWLLLFTDGLSESLSLGVSLPEWERDPTILCDHVMQRWRLPRDDAAVLALCVGH
jgi:serine/threonine protein phosphatase PrpC